MEYANKWNKYTIGEIPWINSRISHPTRMKFISDIFRIKPKSILEIGAGEAIEARVAKIFYPKIRYCLSDVSNTFLQYAEDNDIECYESDMVNLSNSFGANEFDLVYMHGVLEHTPNLKETIKQMSIVSKKYYIVMFKWRIKSGGIKSDYNHQREFYSTEFNLNKVLDTIVSKSKNINIQIVTEKGRVHNYAKYLENIPNVDVHRNGNYITIIGEWKDG